MARCDWHMDKNSYVCLTKYGTHVCFTKKKKKKKSNAIATNYFATFLQIVDVANF